MTPGPTPPPMDPLDDDERELAERLAALDRTAGPSAALDARILAAARAAAAPSPRSPRRGTSAWPTAVGAAAVLVLAVGLAWQLKPLIDMPPPLRDRSHAAGAEPAEEILAPAEPLQRRAVDAAAAALPGSAAASADDTPGRQAPPAPASARLDRPPPARKQAAPTAVAAPDHHEYLDEAIGDAAPMAAPAAAPPPPPAAPEARRFAPAVQTQAPAAGAGTEAAARIATPGADLFGPVATDARLGRADWLERIRARRDAGDAAGARESLQAFVRQHPRVRVPTDLRPLLAAAR